MALGPVELANKIASDLDADVAILNHPLRIPLDQDIIKEVASRRRRKNLILILVTSGGDAHVAYRIARCFQRYYKDGFSAAVAGWCKSAGTLLAIGASKLYMGDLSELGPLDVQIIKKDELGQLQSGLTVNSAIEAIQEIEFELFERFLLMLISRSGGAFTTKTAAEISTALTLGIVQPIAAKIEADRVGEDRRAMNIGKEYAERLSSRSGSLKNAPGSEGIAISMLTGGYPSHAFAIDKEEAAAIFSSVEPYPDWLASLIEKLGRVAVLPLGDGDPDEGVWHFLNKELDDARAEDDSEPTPPAGLQESAGDRTDDSGGVPDGPGSLPGDLPEGAKPAVRRRQPDK